jgi:hypothetical protein
MFAASLTKLLGPFMVSLSLDIVLMTQKLPRQHFVLRWYPPLIFLHSCSALLLLALLPADLTLPGADFAFAKTTPLRRLLGTQATTAVHAAQTAQASQGKASDALIDILCGSLCREVTGWGSVCGQSSDNECCCRSWTGCYLASSWSTGPSDRCY